MYSLNSPEVGDFLTKWFANGKYQFGQKRNHFASSVDGYIDFINYCKTAHEPAFQSVSPQARIEKIFWEFDADIKSTEFNYNSPLLDPVWDEVMTLFLRIKERGGNPFILYSGNRGFHVWVYAYSTEIPEYLGSSEESGKELYKLLHTDVLGDFKTYKYYDKLPSHVNALARIPFSYHQKTGNQVIPLTPLRYPYMPKVEDFISCPLDKKYVDDIEIKSLHKVVGRHESPTRPTSKYEGEYKIRPFIIDAMKREPSHYARLAFVMDAICSGLSDEDIHALLKSFSGTDDYNYYATQYQIQYQRDRVKDGFRPPTNETLVEWGILKELPKAKPDPWKKA